MAVGGRVLSELFPRTLGARSTASSTPLLDRDKAAFDSLQQLADAELIDAQVHFVRLDPQGIVEAFGESNCDHPFRLGGITFGGVLAPHRGDHFLQFGELAALLEGSHLRWSW